MITIRNLRKSYGSNHVLHGIDMDVKAGEFVVMLGLSGAGKSTLLRCMNGLNQPDSGTLQVGGIDLMQKHSRRELARHVAMVFQHHNLVQRLSVRKNVLTGRLGQVGTLASVLQLFRQSDIALADECLQRVGLAHKADERTEALSGGQKQRLSVARALLKDAPILILDEATSSLDTKSERAVQAGLDELMEGRTTLIVAHRLSTISSVDRIVTLRDGRIDEVGSPEELATTGGIYAELLALQGSTAKADKAKLLRYDIVR